MTDAGPSERQVQRSILRWMARTLPEDVFWFHIPNQSAAPPEYVKALLGDGLKPGMVDLMAIVRGQAVGFEVKRPGEYATATQRAIHERLERAGCRCAVVRSDQDVAAAWSRWNLPVAATPAAGEF